MAEYAAHPFLCVDGLAMHIGSQICDLEPYRQAVTRLVGLAQQLIGDGLFGKSPRPGRWLWRGTMVDGQALSLECVAQAGRGDYTIFWR